MLSHTLGLCCTGLMVAVMIFREAVTLGNTSWRESFGFARKPVARVSPFAAMPQASANNWNHLRGSIAAVASRIEELAEQEEVDAVPAVRDTLHLVSACGQCPGKALCAKAFSDQPESMPVGNFILGAPLSDWGCEQLEEQPCMARSAGTGAIYVVQRQNGSSSCRAPATSSLDAQAANDLDGSNSTAPATLGAAAFAPQRHLVTTCDQCPGKNLCTGLLKDEPNVEENYTEGLMLKIWGCQSLAEEPTLVRNSETGDIYVIESAAEVEKRLTFLPYVLLV